MEEVLAREGEVWVRRTTQADVDFVLAVERDPGNAAFVIQWPRERHVTAINDAGAGHFLIEASPDARPIGYAILSGVDGPSRSLELERIALAERGAGYGRPALRLLERLAFDHFGAHRLWLDVMDFNARARALYESEGFVVEGTLRECLLVDGRYVSLIVLSMLEHEFRAR